MKATLENILEIVRLQLGLDKAGAEDRLVEDLGAESADIVNIIAVIEETYGIILDDTAVSRVTSVRSLFDLIREGP